MNLQLTIPDSYKDITTVAAKAIGNDSDLVICTTTKKLMTFFRSCLIKSCDVNIKVKHLEPFIVYEPNFRVYYILHGDNKVVIVKEGTSLQIITTYDNVLEIIVNDHNNSGTPQLYMRTDCGLKCIDNIENEEQNSNETNLSKFQETSVVYKFCTNKLQKLQLLYDTEKYKMSQKTISLINVVMQVSNNISDVKLSPIISRNCWLKLSNEKLVYGFTLQNTLKIPVSNFNLILLEDNKQIWPRYRLECWAMKQNDTAFNFYSGHEKHSMLNNNIDKSQLSLNSESSIIVASVIDDWGCKTLPYFINGIVYTNYVNDRVQYTNTDEIMVTSTLFLNKEFEIFVKNKVLIEDLVTLHCTKLCLCYQIKCTLCFKDFRNIMVNNFKFNTNHEWFILSSLSWLKTFVCYLIPISPSEYNLKVFSDSSMYIKTFIQILSSILPEHTKIIRLDNQVPLNFNVDDVIHDLKELRKVFKEYLNEQIIIPRNKWNSTRLKLMFT